MPIHIAKSGDIFISSNEFRDIIIGITRGGWVPARNLCDFLGIKDLLSLKVEHWGITATPNGEAKLKYPINVDLTGKRVLVVDDITDTGKSMMTAINYIKTLNPAEIKTATLLYITTSKLIPDFYAEEIEWKWIIFPWNVTEDLVTLASNYLKENGIANIEKLSKGLKNWYNIELAKEQIYEVLTEMEFRGLIEIDRQAGTIKRNQLS